MTAQLAHHILRCTSDFLPAVTEAGGVSTVSNWGLSLTGGLEELDRLLEAQEMETAVHERAGGFLEERIEHLQGQKETWTKDRELGFGHLGLEQAGFAGCCWIC